MIQLLIAMFGICLLYTSDAADDLLCVDFGGRRIIKKKNHKSGVRSAADMRVQEKPRVTDRRIPRTVKIPRHNKKSKYNAKL